MAMMSGLVQALNRTWSVGHLVRTRASVLSLAPAAIAVVVFKLAISDGGRDLPSLTLAQVAVFAVLALLVWTGRARLGGVGRAMLVMLGVIAITSLTSVRPEASVRELLQWTMYLGIFVITASTLSGPAAARRVVDALVAIAGWLVLIALFMFWGANNPEMRWYSTFYWPNPFAGFLLLVLPVELVRIGHVKTPREVLAHGALTVLLGTGFVLTYSRGAWLALLATMPVAATLLRPPSWRSAAIRFLTVGIAVLAAVILLTGAPRAGEHGVVRRAASLSASGDVSVQGRLNFWRAALEIFLDHPALGIGPGAFSVVHPRYQQDPRFFARDAHNLYLQTAAESGIPGLASIAIFLFTLISLWSRTLRRSRALNEYPHVLGCGLGLVAFFVHSGLDMNWMFPANPVLASALVGMLVWHERGWSVDLRVRQFVRSPWHRAAAATLVVAIVAVGLAHAAHRAFVQGMQHASSGRWALAAEEYSTAVRLNPLRAQYLSALSASRRRLPGTTQQQSEVLLRRAIVVDRANPTHRIELAELIRTHDPSPARLAEAEALLRNALKLDPHNRPEAYRALAGVYLQLGRADAAAQVYREALPRYRGRGLSDSMLHVFLWPEVVALHLDAADSAWALGERSEAIQILRNLLAEDPSNVPVALRVSQWYVIMGRPGEARAVLHATARVVPENADVRRALEGLR